MRREFDENITIDDVAKRLRIDKRTVYRYVDDGLIENVRIVPRGKRRYFTFSQSSIEHFEKRFPGAVPERPKPKRTYNKRSVRWQKR